jgi:guanylate kinase
MRRPWNQNATGMLAVNNYDEFLKLVETIAQSYVFQNDKFKEPGIVILVGPSGSGKTKVGKEILKLTDKFKKLKSYTTKDPTSLKENDWYDYVTKEKFYEMKEKGELFESSMYAGHGFGSKKEDIENILNEKKSVLATMDICGAMAVKTHFKNVLTIYIKRDRKTMLESILNKKCSNEDKVERIIAIECEKANSEICDYIAQNQDGYEACAKSILEMLKIS